jgi:hypothetical protein
MEANGKIKVRPFYSELQGYLSQAPTPEGSTTIHESSIWEQHNEVVKLLTKETGKDYSRFLLKPRSSDFQGRTRQYLPTIDYRQKLGGLISRLHAEYFSEEPPPFSGMPSTIINQTQQQTQSVHVQMLLDVRSHIDKKLPEFQKGSAERSFLENLKTKLSSVSNVVDLFSLCTKLARDAGISLETLHRIFSSIF